jgi:hypothetical protein
MMFISFAPPKEMNQRKGGRKRQPHQFVAYCAMPFPAPTNLVRFAPFPICPRTDIDTLLSKSYGGGSSLS